MLYSKKIVAVSRILVSRLPKIIRTGNSTTRIIGNVEWEKLKIEIPATLTLNDKVEKKQRVYGAKLVFRVCGDSFKDGIYAYLARLADGTAYLIGSPERPYPVMQTSRQLNASDSSSQLLEVSVSYTSSQEIAFIA